MRDDDCVFCGIEAGDLPARIVFENEHVLAFLDIQPIARGHTLVIPRAHHERLAQLSAETAAALGRALTHLADVVPGAVDAAGATVGFNDGRAAGQEVPHCRAHVIPRHRDDGGRSLHAVLDARPSLDEAALDEIAAEIRSYSAHR